MSQNDAAISIALRLVDQATAPMNQAMAMVERSTMAAEQRMQKLDAGVRIVTAAFAALGGTLAVIDFFKTGFAAVENYKTSVAEATAFITTFSQKVAAGDLSGGFKDANEYAKRLVVELERIDSQTIASGKDLTAISNTMMQNGVMLDVDNKKQVQGFINIANALSLVTVGQNKDVQIRQEINALMQGQIRATDRLPKLLSAIDPQLEEHLKLWKAQGTTIENVGGLLQGFQQSAGLIEQTWMAVGSSLETVRDKVLRDGFLPIYKDILDFATQIRTSLIDTSGQLTPLAVNIQSSIAGAYKSLKLGAMEVYAEILRIGILLDKTGGTMTFLASLPSAIPAVMGVKSSQDRMQRMADYNIMYENRAAEKDAELQRLAAAYNAVESTNFAAVKTKAAAPALKIIPVIDDKAETTAKRLSDQLVAARREWEQKSDLSGLAGVEKELLQIGQAADELRQKFGAQAWIDNGQAIRENAVIQADYQEQFIKQLTHRGQAYEDLLAMEKELELAGMSKDEREIKGIKDSYALLLNKSHLLTLMGRQTEEAEKIFAESVGINMRMDLDNLVKDSKETASALSEFQIQAFRNIQDSGADMFESLRTGGDNFLQNFTQMTLKMVDQWAAAQMMMGLFGDEFGKGGPLGGLLGMGLKAGMSYFAGPDPSAGVPGLDPGDVDVWSAKGNVFSGPGIAAYRNSIVTTPTLFPFARGIGLMGEKPGSPGEAIMPLSRMSGGDLGVKVQTLQNNGGSQQQVNVQVNVVNQSGQEVSAKSGGAQFDGKSYVITTILENIQQGGALRGLFAGAR